MKVPPDWTLRVLLRLKEAVCVNWAPDSIVMLPAMVVAGLDVMVFAATRRFGRLTALKVIAAPAFKITVPVVGAKVASEDQLRRVSPIEPRQEDIVDQCVKCVPIRVQFVLAPFECRRKLIGGTLDDVVGRLR